MTQDDGKAAQSGDGDGAEGNHLPGWWVAILFGTVVSGVGAWAVQSGTGEQPPVRAQPTALAEPGPDGPQSIPLPTALEVPRDPAAVTKGMQLFASKGCVACHKVGGGRLVGPDLKGVLQRRTVAWTARMLLQPEVMLKEDPAAKELLKTYLVPMANQRVHPEQELPFLLAYLTSESQ